MAWTTVRSIIIAISIVSAVILLGFLSSFNITASTQIMSTGFNYGHLLGIGAAFIAFSFWKRYI